jgi:hypothetical protein
MMEPAKDRMRNNVSEPLDRACAGRVLPERNMRSHLVVIDGIFRKDSAKVLRVERDQMISALARTEPIKRSAYPFCQGERNEVGRSRMPMTRTRPLNASPNALSLSWMRYLGAVSRGNASVIWRASHSAVGFWVTANHNSCRRRWPRTRNTKSCRKVNHRNDKEINRYNATSRICLPSAGSWCPMRACAAG